MPVRDVVRAFNICGGTGIRTPDPLHAVPFRWVQVCSLQFNEPHFARPLVQARSPRITAVQNIC